MAIAFAVAEYLSKVGSSCPLRQLCVGQSSFTIKLFLDSQLGCLSLFSTHYHNLAKELLDGNCGTTQSNVLKPPENCDVAVYHMAYDGGDDNGVGSAANYEEGCADIRFLYKFVKGVCYKSFGMNVARYI